MAQLTNINGVSDALPPFPKLGNFTSKLQNRMKIVGCLAKKPSDSPHPIKATSRRVAIGLASLAISTNAGIAISLAEDNGFWLTTPLPIPTVENKIANEETGTRSFLKNGMYIANIGVNGSKYRLRKYAFDLLALEDLLGRDAWSYVRRYLRLKSTAMYYDFDKVISAASVNDEEPLTNLANRLFDSVEKLEEAVKKKDMPRTESYYQNTSTILQEVRDTIVYKYVNYLR